MKNKVLFSIVIPVYNTETYLERCIKSVLNQTITDFELFLIDDGSTDKSPIICDKYASTDDRIKVIHKKNEGANSARNVGINASMGDYICLVDSDDYITDKYLQIIKRSVDNSLEDPDIVILRARAVKGDWEYVKIEPGFYDISRLEKEIFPYAVEQNPKKRHGPLLPLAPWNYAYKADILKNHYCRDNRIKVHNDIAFVFECVFASKCIYVNYEHTYIYDNTTSNSLQRKYQPDLVYSIAYLFEYWNLHLEMMYPNVSSQVNTFKALQIRFMIQKYYSYAPSLLIARRDLAKGIRETNFLEMVETTDYILSDRIRIILMRMHMYLTCLLLQMLVDRVKGNSILTSG